MGCDYRRRARGNAGFGTPLSSLAGTGGTSMPWAPFPTGASTAGFSGTANRALVWGVWVPTYMTFSKINYKVAVVDTSGGTYDIGLGNSSGAIVCHTGNIAASNFTSLGAVQLSLAASCTVPPGRYYVAITCSATSLCATLTATSGNAISFNPTSAGDAVTIAAGGTLSSFTPPPRLLSLGLRLHRFSGFSESLQRKSQNVGVTNP